MAGSKTRQCAALQGVWGSNAPPQKENKAALT